MCCGKTTLLRHFSAYNCIDMDDVFWPQTSKEEYEYYSKRPFTKELSDSLRELFFERISAKAGNPLFGVYILDCEVVVYLDISDDLLKKHCEKRGDTCFLDAFNLKKWIEGDCKEYRNKTNSVFYHLTVNE